MNRLVKRKRKRVEPTISLHEAVARVMQARGCSRREAEEWLRERFVKGEIRTYVQIRHPPGNA